MKQMEQEKNIIVIMINYYFNGNLEFEGEYLNGKKWNGKGYDNNHIIYQLKDGNGLIDTKYFKGEIKNGERNGKEYNLLGKLIYEGEYLNGKRWNGNEKEYDEYGKLIFEGEYLNGKRWNGKRYNNNQVIYELKEGKGYIKEYYDNCNLMFEGE